MTTSNDSALLPTSHLEQQLLAIDLLLSMFSLPGEIEQSDSNAASVESLREYLEDPSSNPPSLPTSADVSLNVTIDPEHVLQLHIRFLLHRTNEAKDEAADPDEPPLPLIMCRCPSWMNRKVHADIIQRMPIDSPDSVLMVVDFLKEEVINYLDTRAALVPGEPKSQTGKLVRVWFYLQSLSTRSKRDDMVNWAPGYGLTGFVLAGKPGILCLEGTSDNVSAYMSDIKTRSWSDIPSHQKKVSERYREEGANVDRVFRNMREVTGEISRGGHRGNRGEMSEVKSMFEKVGLGDVFAEVLGLQSF